MKLIVGLGNPGRAYARTRHNIGFLAVSALAERYGVSLKKDRMTYSLSARLTSGRQHVILAEPVTYMNLSGLALKSLVGIHKIGLSEILVVLDDLDLSFGRFRIRPGGQSAGHRGLKSIAGTLGSTAFARLRIGIGRPPEGVDPADYVLSAFTRIERKELDTIIPQATDCCRMWVDKGIEECMNVYNKKSKRQ
ncbi:MAG: aminoacyl-tRNA hydrolase [Candidatus Omnitrophica bacterium]|nr:aminoacyl-tRNA hydrolase [Candidatus Omnitrophota bacterium]